MLGGQRVGIERARRRRRWRRRPGSGSRPARRRPGRPSTSRCSGAAGRRRPAARAARARSTVDVPGRGRCRTAPTRRAPRHRRTGRGLRRRRSRSRPRLGWQVIRVYLPVRAQCTQCSLPATRSPVSSNPATSASAIRCVTVPRKPSEPVGGAFGHRRDGALRDRGAEQFGQRLGGAFLRQELSHIQIQHDRGDPRPVLHRRGHTLRAPCRRWWPHTAAARHQLVLDHPHRHRRQVEHLPPLHRDLGHVRQVVPHPPQRPRLVPLHLVRVSDLRQRRPRMPRLPTRFASALAPQRLRRRLGERRVGRRRLRRIRRILIQPAAQFRDSQPQHISGSNGDLRLQRPRSLPKLRVLRRELLAGRTSIGRHHTMIRIRRQRSTRHAHQATEDLTDHISHTATART